MMSAGVPAALEVSSHGHLFLEFGPAQQRDERRECRNVF